MVYVGIWQDEPFTVSVKENCLTISIGLPEKANVTCFDLQGRLWTTYAAGVSYRRGLDGRIIARWRTDLGERTRKWLSPEEGLLIENQARAATIRLSRAIAENDADLNTPLPPHGMEYLQQIEAFDKARSSADVDRYFSVYKPIGILPPDRYMAIVLQATEGCSFNTCSYCSFYQDRPFRIKKPTEFLEHATAVLEFLGKGLSLRRTIFLADANALVVPMANLVPLFEVAHNVFDVDKVGGIYAFVDGFSGDRKTNSDYATLRSLGLKRVYIGLESGSSKLLRFLKKPGEPGDVVRAVRTMKSAGISVGVIVLLGAGGRQYDDEHVEETIRVINNMDLGENDIVYFSELVVNEEMAYAQEATSAGLVPLTRDERLAQGKRIRNGLRFKQQRGGAPRISHYDIREFVY